MTPELLDRFQRVLVRHDPVPVTTCVLAMRALEDHIGMVILDVHFEDSQMFLS